MLSSNYVVDSMGVGAGLCMYDVVVKEFTFAISSPDEFLYVLWALSDTNNKEKQDSKRDKSSQAWQVARTGITPIELATLKRNK